MERHAPDCPYTWYISRFPLWRRDRGMRISSDITDILPLFGISYPHSPPSWLMSQTIRDEHDPGICPFGNNDSSRIFVATACWRDPGRMAVSGADIKCSNHIRPPELVFPEKAGSRNQRYHFPQLICRFIHSHATEQSIYHFFY
jgi:hypothetical protein